MTTAAPTTAAADARPADLRWMVLVTVIVGTFLGRLDQTIVNLALPKIINDFGITVTSAGWIATAYILANAVFVPIWGKLGDTIGRKRIYVLGFSLFIVGSVLAGFAWNLGSMIVFRVIQAIAGSADYPTAMAILAVTFPGQKERAQALGIWSSSFAAAAVFGPLIGGPLIDVFGWRSVFLVNLPVGIVGLLMAQAFIRESVSGRRTVKFDWFGSLALGVALSSLVLVLDKGLDWGWTSGRSLLAFGVGAAFTALFVVIERWHPEPIVDLKFFANKVFLNALINNFVVFMGMMGGLFLVPVFAQAFLGLDATQTGILFMPMAAAMMVAAPIGGRLTGRVQPRIVIFASTIVAAIGIGLFARIDVRSGPWDIMVPMFIMAFGMGFGMAQRTSIVAAAVPQSEIGIASSVLALGRNIAGAFGIAIFGTVLTYAMKANVLDIAASSAIQSHDPAVVASFMRLIALKAQVDAYRTVFIVGAVIVAAGAFLAFLIPDVEMKKGVTVHVE
ncbi:MAG TPA: DHA2 family efflux MFS transporter permease subunit [Candidatus Binatia bacterium]|nr:DHA2 family efflux MFS transporter permease subunit [Candidatus Binatia bacterium]